MKLTKNERIVLSALYGRFPTFSKVVAAYLEKQKNRVHITLVYLSTLSVALMIFFILLRRSNDSLVPLFLADLTLYLGAAGIFYILGLQIYIAYKYIRAGYDIKKI